ncbi:hypothetical protein LY78DRAFT_161504 [Colletotrichum sublineola]|nr:hypothetical protein LY78DRAFT_161504 [Colletotrichum sublineola]
MPCSVYSGLLFRAIVPLANANARFLCTFCGPAFLLGAPARRLRLLWPVDRVLVRPEIDTYNNRMSLFVVYGKFGAHNRLYMQWSAKAPGLNVSIIRSREERRGQNCCEEMAKDRLCLAGG